MKNCLINFIRVFYPLQKNDGAKRLNCFCRNFFQKFFYGCESVTVVRGDFCGARIHMFFTPFFVVFHPHETRGGFMAELFEINKRIDFHMKFFVFVYSRFCFGKKMSQNVGKRLKRFKQKKRAKVFCFLSMKKIFQFIIILEQRASCFNVDKMLQKMR